MQRIIDVICALKKIVNKHVISGKYMWLEVEHLLLNDFHLIQGDIEACRSSVASSSTFIASCWRKHKPFHTAYTSNLTLGERPARLYESLLGNMCSISSIWLHESTEHANMSARLLCDLHWKREKRGGKKCMVMNKSQYTEVINASFTGHKFTLKSRKRLLRERCRLVT